MEVLLEDQKANLDVYFFDTVVLASMMPSRVWRINNLEDGVNKASNTPQNFLIVKKNVET